VNADMFERLAALKEQHQQLYIKSKRSTSKSGIAIGNAIDALDSWFRKHAEPAQLRGNTS